MRGNPNDPAHANEIARQKTAHLIEALEAADEFLAMIEDVGHGAMMDNVTVARRIVLSAISSANGSVEPGRSASDITRGHV